jgi:Na+/proline symporter/signal transduction histidine kinase
MKFELTELFGIAIAYLVVLFGVAYASERKWIPDRLVKHPVVYVLSLGVYAGAWAFFGAVDLAYQYGWGFLTYYFGASAIFLFSPLILLPLLRICRLYQLNSLADLLTFRYRSQWAGSIVTLCMLFAIMPLLALQIQAVSEVVEILSLDNLEATSGSTPQETLAQIFCLIIMMFTILFGARHASSQQRHNGLVIAIAFETIVKSISLVILGLSAVYFVFGGFEGLDTWLDRNPHYPAMLHSRLQEGSFRTLLLVFFSSGLILPHIFHMTFAENPSPKAISVASWAAPLLFLFLSLPVLPILWAGLELGSGESPQYFTLTLGLDLEHRWLAIIAYIGGLSAASGTMIVITISLASMCLNHLILPIYQPNIEKDIYRWLLWIRRLLISAIIFAAYLSFSLLHHHDNLSGLGFAAFGAMLQFLPGLLAVLYWPMANRTGFLAGLGIGFALWFLMLLLPALSNEPLSYIPLIKAMMPHDTGDHWGVTILFTLGVNMVTFAVISLLSRTNDEERTAAELCSQDDLNRPMRQSLGINSVIEMSNRLAETLGTNTAEREVNRALTDLKLNKSEQRPYALRRLRDRIEANLSGLMGPSVAHDVVNRHLPYIPNDNSSHNEDIYLIENRLDSFKTNLTGLAAQLDNLRRYHRNTLQNLPIGVCALGSDKEFLMWNRAMEQLTGIPGEEIIGSYVDTIPAPWSALLGNFSDNSEPHLHKQHVECDFIPRWISLHKASQDEHQPNTANDNTAPQSNDSQVIVVEDLTETQMLEQELIHSERLASIGRLAAGVAHEIGNPVTGIACLAQNLRYDSDNPIIHETAEDIVTQTKRITRIVQSLVNFSHSGHHQKPEGNCAVDMAECVQEAIDLLSLNKDYKEISMHNEIMPGMLATGDMQRLQQVFINLLSNAKDACPDYGQITITAEVLERELLIVVTDTGSGIPKELQEQIFDPFFTTKEAGEGTGLGLSLVYSIIEDHKGHISLESPVDQESLSGTRFRIRLPLFHEHKEY